MRSSRSRLATRLDLTGRCELMLAHHALMLLVNALDPVLQHPVDPARHQLDDLVDAAGAGHGVGLQANQLTDAELVAWHGRLLRLERGEEPILPDGSSRKSRRRSLRRSRSLGLEVSGRLLAGALVGLDLEGDLLAVAQAADAGALERGRVDEDVLAARVRRDEAVALLVVVPLHRARIHGGCPLAVCTFGRRAHRGRADLSMSGERV